MEKKIKVDKKPKNSKMKKRQIFILLGVIVILGIVGTLAWWRWSSAINALIYGEGCSPKITFRGGTTINGVGMLPVRTKEEGLSKDIYINLNDTCYEDTAVINLKLKLEEFSSGLSDASFKWALYEVTEEEIEGTPTEVETFVDSGNFANRVQADVVPISEDLIVTENVSTYRLYIWIDATMDNPSTMGDKIFRFKIYGEGYGAIYNEYTMARKSNSAAASSFWGSPINANQVKTLRFVQTDEVPSTYTGTYDISSSANAGHVMMYYMPNETTPSLYDVYIANTHGGFVRASTSLEYTFAYLSNCELIDLTAFNTVNTTSFNRMFQGDAKVTQIILNNLDTSKVTTMGFMFSGCSKLASLDLSGFDTRKVSSMRGMFMNCSSLKELDLSNFYTPVLSNVTEGTNYGMFKGCSSLESIDFRNFNTSRITDMRQLFYGCSKLKKLDLSTWNMSNVTNVSGSQANSMFNGCTSLEYLNVSNWNTSKVTNMNYLFAGLTSLRTIVLDNFNTSNVTSMTNMFNGSNKLATINFSSFNTSKVTSMDSMFRNCSGLTSLDLSGFKTSNVTNMYAMFQGCSNLKNIDLSSFDTSKLNYIGGASNNNGMFAGCSKLETVNLSSFDLSKVTSVRAMFYQDTKLKEIDLSTAVFSQLTDITNTFNGVPAACKIYVDCSQRDAFIGKFGSRTGLTTVNNESCNV